jgi:hypothetical protein
MSFITVIHTSEHSFICFLLDFHICPLSCSIIYLTFPLSCVSFLSCRPFLVPTPSFRELSVNVVLSIPLLFLSCYPCLFSSRSTSSCFFISLSFQQFLFPQFFPLLYFHLPSFKILTPNRIVVSSTHFTFKATDDLKRIVLFLLKI